MFPEEADFDDDLEFQCITCGETFKMLGAKFRHMADKHPNPDDAQAVDNAVD